MAAKKPIFDTPYEPRPPCEKCGNSAIMRKYLPTGWANLCEACNLEIHQKRAVAYCAERGLHTVAEMRAWLKRNKLNVRRGPVRERVPGDDDEEIDNRAIASAVASGNMDEAARLRGAK